MYLGLEFLNEKNHVRFNNHDPQMIFRLAPLKCERAVLNRYLPLLEVCSRCVSNRSLLVWCSTWWRSAISAVNKKERTMAQAFDVGAFKVWGCGAEPLLTVTWGFFVDVMHWRLLAMTYVLVGLYKKIKVFNPEGGSFEKWCTAH